MPNGQNLFDVTNPAAILRRDVFSNLPTGYPRHIYQRSLSAKTRSHQPWGEFSIANEWVLDNSVVTQDYFISSSTRFTMNTEGRERTDFFPFLI